VLLSYNFFKIY